MSISQLALIALCLVALPAHAAERGFNTYDGDTTWAKFRISNIDAPEIRGACDAEKKLAIEAREFTRAWLAKGRVVIRQDTKRPMDREGRILARFERDGEDLGEALIRAGLARPWEGKRQPWC